MTDALRELETDLDEFTEATLGAVERLTERVGRLEEELRQIREARAVSVYRGIWRPEATYSPGHQATFRGALWHCHEQTTATPGESAAWQLATKSDKEAR